MGKGRSTTGMVVASLVHILRDSNVAKQMIYDLSPKPGNIYLADTPSTDRGGFSKPISTLLKLLNNGREIKKIVDAQIDKCSMSLNLRDIIFETL